MLRRGVEATIAGRQGGWCPPPSTADEYLDALRESADDYDEVAQRFGSALYSKQQKEYHLFNHVAGRPLLFAIQGFFDVGSLCHTEMPLVSYLFGRQFVDKPYAPDRQLTNLRIEEHATGEKTIPSGWFSHAGNENVAAVIFSNCGTVAKFTRMGTLAGMLPSGVTVYRSGDELDATPGAREPRRFREQVGTVRYGSQSGRVECVVLRTRD